ncbi:hypothetical protein L950_0214630 [Sphingobacterium sp. IITKGP-BTPF85]|nr:hypothetical protein L950_0214630 [Sphingobacterium sp. IITKGP-BTPF85]
MEDNRNKKITTASGAPVVNYEDTMTIGPRGPVLLQDYFLHEKLAHFNRERIPERIVHAKGSGAYGTFTVTNDISKYTRAKLFNGIGKQTKLFIRFSTVGGERGSADSERDPRGFAVNFIPKMETTTWSVIIRQSSLSRMLKNFLILFTLKREILIQTVNRQPWSGTSGHSIPNRCTK